MAVQWYFRRIRKVIVDITSATVEALPANRKIIADFVSSWHVRWVEDVLSGLRDVDEWDSIDWASDTMFMKFKDYVIENERKMEHNLRGVNYVIDEANTLSLVAGDGRPEKVSVPTCVHGDDQGSESFCDCCSTSCPSFTSFSEEASTLFSRRTL